MTTNIKLDIYTAHHVDNKEKDVAGAVFGAVLVRDGKKQTKELYGEDDTYMTIWFKGVANIVSEIDKKLSRDDDKTLNLTIYMWHTNVQKMCVKLGSVYRSLKDFDQDVSRLLDRKLLKTNRTKYDTHDSQVELMAALLSINQKVTLNLKFKPLPPKDPNMGMAYQHAELIMEDIKTEDMTG